jgi:hypothetical protein
MGTAPLVAVLLIPEVVAPGQTLTKGRQTMKIALGAAAALITLGAALGMGTAHADDLGYGTDDDGAYAMGACMLLGHFYKMTPAQVEVQLLNGTNTRR